MFGLGIAPGAAMSFGFFPVKGNQARGIYATVLSIGLHLVAGGQTPATGEEPADGTDRWFVEGVVEQVDEELAEHFATGWRLEGSLLVTLMDLSPVDKEGSEAGEGRLTGGVTAGEFSVVEYHEVQWSGRQREGLAGLDYVMGSEEGQPDEGEWFVPVEGALGDGGWQASWLQVWLWNEAGALIGGDPPLISPYGIDWETGSFRIRFVSEEGGQADIAGTVRVFDPLAGEEPPGELEQLRGEVADLADRLRSRDADIRTLRAELMDARDQLASAQAVIDRLGEERIQLEEEMERLREQVETLDPSAKEKLAALQADKVLLADELEGERERRKSLLAKLDHAYGRIERQLLRMESLEDQLAEAKEEGKGEPAAVPERTLVVAEAPMVIEKPVVVENLEAGMIRSVESSAQLEETGDRPHRTPATRRRFGPRKFR